MRIMREVHCINVDTDAFAGAEASAAPCASNTLTCCSRTARRRLSPMFIGNFMGEFYRQWLAFSDRQIGDDLTAQMLDQLNSALNGPLW